MPVKNPKNKGNEFERKVAKMLSEWSGVKFMRTPASGAIHNFKDKRVVSDIVAPLSIAASKGRQRIISFSSIYRTNAA